MSRASAFGLPTQWPGAMQLLPPVGSSCVRLRSVLPAVLSRCLVAGQGVRSLQRCHLCLVVAEHPWSSGAIPQPAALIGDLPRDFVPDVVNGFGAEVPSDTDPLHVRGTD